jgi:NAD+ synthase (glutamine-hydrolysing)
VKVALGQINPTVGDFQGNAAKIIELAQRAQSAGCRTDSFSGTISSRISAA